MTSSESFYKYKVSNEFRQCFTKALVRKVGGKEYERESLESERLGVTPYVPVNAVNAFVLERGRYPPSSKFRTINTSISKIAAGRFFNY